MERLIKTCINCRYVGNKPKGWSCKTCSRSYSDQWDRATDEQIKFTKSAISDFRNRLEKRLPDAREGYDGLNVDDLIADVQNEMLKELEDEID